MSIKYFKHPIYRSATGSGKIQQCFGNVALRMFCGIDIVEGQTATVEMLSM
jgi:hypothetical protein